MLESVFNIIVFLFFWILKFSLVLIIAVIIGGILGFLITTLRVFSIAMIISAMYFFLLFFNGKGTFHEIIVAISCVCTVIGIIFWIVSFRKKAIRKSKVFKSAKLMTMIVVISQMILTTMYPFEQIIEFKSVCNDGTFLSYACLYNV